jgi:hypothetical protein
MIVWARKVIKRSEAPTVDGLSHFIPETRARAASSDEPSEVFWCLMGNSLLLDRPTRDLDNLVVLRVSAAFPRQVRNDAVG